MHFLANRHGAAAPHSRHITRPAPSDERVQFNAARQVELKLKTP